MKILLDANISWKLVDQLTSIYGECTHVDHLGYDIPVADIDIWNYALQNGFIIFSQQPPPEVVACMWPLKEAWL